MNALLWVSISYLSGSLPFSVWMGRLLLQTEIRRYGDGNPGGTNVIRAGSRALGITVIALDALKGLLPVLGAQHVGGIDGWPLAVVALSAVSGHAFSIFLRLKGGKAVAVTFGVWAGLTGWSTLFLLGALLLAAYLLVSIDGWAVIFALIGLLIFLLATGNPIDLLGAWLGNTLIVAWKHRRELAHPPSLRRPTPL